jgi:hypothetical protein
VSELTYKLPAALEAPVKSNIEDWRSGGKVDRLCQRGGARSGRCGSEW